MQLTSIEQLMLLQRLPQTGIAAYWRVLEQFSNLNTVFEVPPATLKGLLHEQARECLLALQKQGESHPLLQVVRKNIAWLHERNIHIVHIDNEYYPSLLREVKRAPLLMYVWGDPTLLNLPQIAIVGSRSPTTGGRTNAITFSRGLAEAGFTITSGLALGVDVAAHQGALQAKGRTLAILGTGIDQIYPARHVHIAEDIVAAGGAVVSEFPLGTGPLPSNFPQRNRIISGLSCGVLVVEAAVKSGSLITARYALQQDREVFAIPGSIQNPLSKGCHALIKEGAKLVECPEDVVEELQGILAFKHTELVEKHVQAPISRDVGGEHSSDEERILTYLGYDPVSFDALAEGTALPTGELMARLMTMEIKGLVTNMGHGYARVRS
ncbi:DNA-processing protein DprA [Marinagarivorans algicola]|uniref:DNA-processing protein DprA n=1 Tax=Marinagarivorans algicola TaxID=1513270 RepID=UPI000ABA3F65|nr:DNA-processing protein DprA [Marinagarivorans algicola]